MKTLKFKTNLNCGNCLATAKPFLDKIKNVEGWSVDTNDPEKILTVKGDEVNAANVLEMVQMAGFIAEEKIGPIGKLFR